MSSSSRPRSRIYWMYRRQVFFLKQRLFYILSFVLLDNNICGRMRAALLRWNGAAVGRNCFIRGGLLIQEDFNFIIGSDVFINAGCCLDASAPITIGDRVQLGYNVTIMTGDHKIGDSLRRCGDFDARPVIIEAGAWIGAGATITPGVTVGAGSVVSAGAVVVTNVLPNKVVGGNPARPVKTLEETPPALT